MSMKPDPRNGLHSCKVVEAVAVANCNMRVVDIVRSGSMIVKPGSKAS